MKNISWLVFPVKGKDSTFGNISKSTFNKDLLLSKDQDLEISQSDFLLDSTLRRYRIKKDCKGKHPVGIQVPPIIEETLWQKAQDKRETGRGMD